jgi:hypothetical protein
VLARISTHFDCTEEEFWDKIVEPESLRFVSAPLVVFEPLVEGALDGEWTTDRSYELKLYLLGVLPLGRHTIRLVAIDRELNTIVSNEGGALAPVWNHTIRFHRDEGGQLAYTDEIEIEAGWRTPFIWAFAHLFYRHRQRRWRKLLKCT